MIAIIDYGMGNLRSVANAFRAVGADARIAADPTALPDARAIVLPGVGAFGDGMRNLRERGFLGALEREVREQGKPLLGLCLGMQLLGTVSYEHGEHAGLGWVDAVVERIPSPVGGTRLRVPHIGWNDVRFTRPGGLFAGMGASETFYFVHSYYVRCNDPAAVSGECHYGLTFAASLQQGNLYATQFHPEKSHKAGLATLRNFVEIVAGAHG